MREAYEYKDKVYLTEDLVHEAICELEEEPRNNQDPNDYIDFAMVWKYDVEVLDLDDWETFKDWCKQEGLKPQKASSVERYYEVALCLNALN